MDYNKNGKIDTEDLIIQEEIDKSMQYVGAKGAEKGLLLIIVGLVIIIGMIKVIF